MTIPNKGFVYKRCTHWPMLPRNQDFALVLLPTNILSPSEMAEDRLVDQLSLYHPLGYRIHTLLYPTVYTSQLLLAAHVSLVPHSTAIASHWTMPFCNTGSGRPASGIQLGLGLWNLAATSRHSGTTSDAYDSEDWSNCPLFVRPTASTTFFSIDVISD
jgi:hypothetical protein